MPGGHLNAAAGDYSLAAGYRAKVGSGHFGAFVWADMTEADFASAAANEFAVRASGGVRLEGNVAASGTLTVDKFAMLTGGVGVGTQTEIFAGALSITLTGSRLVLTSGDANTPTSVTLAGVAAGQLVIVRNEDADANAVIGVGGGATVTVAAGKTRLLFVVDGDNVQALTPETDN